MLDGLTIRKYKDQDLEACRHLWEELTSAHRTIYEDPSIGGTDPGKYFDGHLSDIGPENVWVACFGGEVVGLIGLEVGDDEITIEPLVVSESWRGRGIGGALCDIALEQARARNMKYLSVKPVARNTDALRFFRTRGMGIIGHVELFFDLRNGRWKEGLELHGLGFRY